MNTVVSYLMAFALQLVAIILPHQNENTTTAFPHRYEESIKITQDLIPVKNNQKQEDECYI